LVILCRDPARAEGCGYVTHIASGASGRVQVACSASTQQSAAGCLGCVVLFYTGDINMTYHTAKHIVKVQQIPNGKYVCSDISRKPNNGRVSDFVTPVILFGSLSESGRSMVARAKQSKR
jgi:hypothetical protein